MIYFTYGNIQETFIFYVQIVYSHVRVSIGRGEEDTGRGRRGEEKGKKWLSLETVT